MTIGRQGLGVLGAVGPGRGIERLDVYSTQVDGSPKDPCPNSKPGL